MGSVYTFGSASTHSSCRLLQERLISVLQSCKTFKHLRQLQSHATTNGFHRSEHIMQKFIANCASLKEMEYARKVFDEIPEPSVSCWNAMFKGYYQNSFHREVITSFNRMKSLDISPNSYSFPVVLKSCVKLNALTEGQELHCFVIKNGFKSNPFVGTTLIEMYSSVNLIELANTVFCEMLERNVVAWTAMINGYISCKDTTSARQLFDLAPDRDIVLWNTMISGYIASGDMVRARELFDKMSKKDVMAWNTVLNGYANHGDVESCERFFDEMPERNVFSWNGLLGGFARNGCFPKVISTFKRMLAEHGSGQFQSRAVNSEKIAPNDATFVIVLSACAKLGALDLGRWIHINVNASGYSENLYVGNALIDMYAKCGVMESAVEVFRTMKRKDLISWNTIICGLASHGHGFDALKMFNEMQTAGERPDAITFIGVISGCVHIGFVERGFSYFRSMISDYSIEPRIEHYGCMVDLLGRAGLLGQAVDFIAQMPMEADAVMWATLLAACRVYKNVEFAELALGKLVEFDSRNPANYVMLSNVYGDVGRWKDLARLKVKMRDTGVKKMPGTSSIEVGDEVSEFYSLDERHGDSGRIYEALKGLTRVSRLYCCVPERDSDIV
ncbi:Pentatricopeptide repeat-containing protein At3g29230 [Linum grandiflorum]